MFDDRRNTRVSEESWGEKARRISAGLKAPKDSGEHRYAVAALQRIFGPSFASTTVCVVVLLLLLICVRFSTDSPPPELDVTMVDPEIEELDEIIEETIDEPVSEVVTLEPAFEQLEVADIDVDMDSVSMSDDNAELAPVAVDTIKSAMVLKGLYGARGSAAGRAAAMSRGGGTGSHTSVLKALRWLKDHQQANGSWQGSKSTTGMTGLALLCYMAHGETTASAEFGDTVERAIRHLLSVQGKNGQFANIDDGDSRKGVYGQAIGAYALAESYGMTKMVMLKEPLERAVQVIIDGQRDDGAWSYEYDKQTYRRDLSVTAWQIQALKAANLSGAENEGLKDAIERSVKGIKTFSLDNGSLYYANRRRQNGPSIPMTAAGSLCLQLLGKASDSVVSRGLNVLAAVPCEWPIDTYMAYYATQAKFQNGGAMWDAWNKQMLPMLVANQEDDGHWFSGKAEGASDVYDTTLCCLCLEVYYRYLPTYARVEEVEREPKNKAEQDIKVAVDITL